MRGTITINEDRCKGCTLCTTVCPKGIIIMADYFTPGGYHPARLVDPQDACTGCLLCSTICPDAAITVYRESAARRPGPVGTAPPARSRVAPALAPAGGANP